MPPHLQDLEKLGAEWLRGDFPDGLAFYALDARFSPAALLSLGALDQPQLPGDGVLLKAARQRFVARLPHPAGGSVVVKCFPLRNPLSMLRWRKYALTEVVNQARAAAAGLVRASAVMMEDLAGWQDLRQLGDDNLALEPLALLAAKGIHHIDARDENILYAPDLSRFAVIDWQYAAFPGPMAPGLAEHLAAYYIAKASPERQTALQGTWLEGFFHRLPSAPQLGPFPSFAARVSTLLARQPGVKDRLRRRI